ncbi:hypothetical protein Pen02_81980 [Plantactinospora endophytica]|uniref:DUF35 domain-containing protein n=1 Tax=Plantactinospora endophytica TaxID=673535 RepID=A0ABQ4EEU8_9ACTN|nr:hypothetical protein Pen02_81980 [Plantactinospora endophytica]
MTATPPGQLVRDCACGQPLHPGSIMASTTDDGPFEAIVIKVGPTEPEPLHRALYLVSLDTGQALLGSGSLFTLHLGDLLTWQIEVGEPVRCGSPRDVLPRRGGWPVVR